MVVSQHLFGLGYLWFIDVCSVNQDVNSRTSVKVRNICWWLKRLDLHTGHYEESMKQWQVETVRANLQAISYKPVFISNHDNKS